MRRAVGALLGFAMVGLDLPAAAQSVAEFDFPIQAQSLEPRPSRQFVSTTYQYIVGPKAVPLAGAGTLHFPVSFSSLPIARKDWGLPFAARVQLTFDGKGNPLECTTKTLEYGWATSSPGWTLDEASESVCREFKRSARFIKASWFAVPVDQGFIDVRVEATRTIAAARPVKLLPRKEGAGVEMTVWRFGGRTMCEADSARVSRADGTAICEVLLAEEQIVRLGADSERQNGRKIKLMAYVGVLKESGPRGQVKVDVDPGDLYLRPVYPAPMGLDFLPDSAGKLQVDLYTDDHPFSGRYLYVTGRVVVVLGIAPNGKIKTCRPLESGGVAWLDNQTCEKLARRGRYLFSDPKFARFQGLRYVTRPITWTDPG